jgi:hypothetical protein
MEIEIFIPVKRSATGPVTINNYAAALINFHVAFQIFYEVAPDDEHAG